MSKSKKNVIAPETIIAEYGADTIRWFMLSDTPPERDIEWTDAGRGRLLALCPARLAPGDRSGRPGPPPAPRPPADDSVQSRCARPPHKAIAAVTDDLENLRFNRAVAQLYTLANAIGGAEKPMARRGAKRWKRWCCCAAPMMPHLAEQCWQALGHDTLVARNALAQT